jgi:signal transduction histidine kinase
MHDDVTQRLAGLAMLAWSTLQALERGGDQKSSAQMQELALALEGVANDVQVLSRELHPPALETLGLVDALHSECRTFAQRTGFEVEFDCVEPISEPNAAAGLAIYRIVQEALRNARTHSSSANAIVSVRSTNAMLQVEVRDFGHGFDPAAKRTHGGMGLASMQERARLAGATFTLESSAGEGTCCRVELPLG